MSCPGATGKDGLSGYGYGEVIGERRGEGRGDGVLLDLGTVAAQRRQSGTWNKLLRPCHADVLFRL